MNKGYLHQEKKILLKGSTLIEVIVAGIIFAFTISMGSKFINAGLKSQFIAFSVDDWQVFIEKTSALALSTSLSPSPNILPLNIPAPENIQKLELKEFFPVGMSNWKIIIFTATTRVGNNYTWKVYKTL